MKNDTEEKTTLKEKADSLAQNKAKKPKGETTLKTTLKEKQIHSQENGTQSRPKHASKTEEIAIREIKLTQNQNGRY